ncbi:MAG: tRNA (adenosine(37)-N6)-threonylcarbamoyltransferase complex ATPase subunit type 1 TsaE [Candidatus Acidiferrales bacterium]
MRATIREVITSSPEETTALGRELARELQPPALVALSGELGSGKTTLVKGIVSGLGLATEEEVSSPSFVFVHVFSNHTRLYHVDLYRVEEPTELETLGLDDLLAERAIVVVEWAERLPRPAGRPTVSVRLEVLSDEQRRICIEGAGDENEGK